MQEINAETNINDGMVFVDFWAEWCAPCRMMSATFEKLSADHSDIKFYKNNVEEYKDLARKMNINSIPTFIMFKDGKEVFRIVGAKPEKEFNDLFEHNMDKLQK
jgi:thioredoxin 1